MNTGKAVKLATLVFTLLLVLSQVSQAQEQATMSPVRIDIFTTADQPARGVDTVMEEHSDIKVHIHEIDAIRKFEIELSQDLPIDPNTAKREALRRLQRMSKEMQRQLQLSGTALARALHLGIDKYPAIVFDGELVVYGLSDLTLALGHYRHWRLGESS